MASLNKVFLIGNLTREVEALQTQAGVAIAKFGLAINNKWTGKDGQKHDETTFVNVTAFEQLAKTCETYLHKGSPIFLEGRLKLDQWQDKNTNQKRSAISVVAERIQFLGKNEAAAPPPQQPAPSEQPRGDSWEPPPTPADGDNIPF